MSESIQQVGNAVIIAIADERTDARLLECFLTTHDETAFETLVRRHGPMVLGVCNRVLQHRQDAEDAFQATFLVLVRKADSIVPRGMVGNWLYGVAYQTARKAQAMANRRGARERQVMDPPEPPVTERDEALWRELRPIIDAELSRLPAKYRAPLVLCDLEEKSYKEAAEQLGWPEGTVAGRLSRARAMLAKRLHRRGVVLPLVALPFLLTQKAAASVPAALTVPTVQAAALVVAGQATTGAVSANVLALTEGVMKAMLLSKLKIATALLLGACLTVSGVGFGISPSPAAAQDQKKAQPPGKKVDPKNGNGDNNQNGNNEKNGNNNQNGNNEQNGNNNQNGNDEKNGNNNQNGKNGQNNQNGNGGGAKNGNNGGNGNGLGALKLGNGKNQPNGNNGKGKNEPNGGNNQNGNNGKGGNGTPPPANSQKNG